MLRHTTTSVVTGGNQNNKEYSHRRVANQLLQNQTLNHTGSTAIEFNGRFAQKSAVASPQFFTLKLTWFAASDVTGVLAGFSADLDDGHISARHTV